MASPPEITPAERIRELNEINASLASTLRTMSEAISLLSPRPYPEHPTPESRKAAIEERIRAAYTGIQAFSAKTKRQAYALEEAGIIAAQAPHLSATAGGKITNGGLGNLDVGWLNSRRNQVGLEKEAELLREARELLENEVKKRKEGEDGDEDMG